MKQYDIRRVSSIAAACILTAASLTSCGDGSDSPYSSSKADNSSAGENYNYSYETADEAEEEYYGGYYEPVIPSYPSQNEEYHGYTESGFHDAETEPLSTFSADADTASYSNARRLLEDGMIVPEDAVRIEEFINYFDYSYPDPESGVFGEYVTLADCPWNASTKLMQIGIQGTRMDEEEAPPLNLVFLIDSSGSMSSYDKLPLVQTAFTMLAENLSEDDRISIVTYAGSSCTLIEGADGSRRDDIVEALYSITASGGTNGEGGIETAYELAEEYFIKGGSNRVILATDGDLNIGASSESELTRLIEKKRESGIYLSVLGFGTGNLKDNKLEALADNGNGTYSYIDSVEEARRVLVEEMGGDLCTIAKDVKIQVEFNPSQIKSYRLVGYDNRLMEAEDFFDTEKDAGEVGAGHSVTALYEVELANGTDDGTYHGIELEFADQHTQPLENRTADTSDRQELCKVSVTYKDIDTDESVYISELFGMERYTAAPDERMQLAAAAAELGMLLRSSEYSGSSSYSYVIKTAEAVADRFSRAEELAELAAAAERLD